MIIGAKAVVINDTITNATRISTREKAKLTRIKFYREAKNLTQEQLAEKIGINSKSLSTIECGQNYVTAQTLENISTALDISIKKFFDFEEEYSNNIKIKDKLFELINNNEEKIPTIYKIIKGYLD